jgi:hypothetical protein
VRAAAAVFWTQIGPDQALAANIMGMPLHLDAITNSDTSFPTITSNLAGLLHLPHEGAASSPMSHRAERLLQRPRPFEPRSAQGWPAPPPLAFGSAASPFPSSPPRCRSLSHHSPRTAPPLASGPRQDDTPPSHRPGSQEALNPCPLHRRRPTDEGLGGDEGREWGGGAAAAGGLGFHSPVA